MIYLIRSARMQSYKIGYAVEVDRRWSAIRVHVPDAVLLATTEGARPLEARIHAAYWTYHWAGEWFDLPQAVATELALHLSTGTIEALLLPKYPHINGMKAVEAQIFQHEKALRRQQ